jgi:hypothetical protein
MSSSSTHPHRGPQLPHDLHTARQGIFATLDQAFQAETAAAEAIRQLDAPPHFRRHSTLPDVLVEDRIGERPAFTRICDEHGWASMGDEDRAQDVAGCPYCLADRDGRLGQLRYRLIQCRLREGL